jgi:hypothetical protein
LLYQVTSFDDAKIINEFIKFKTITDLIKENRLEYSLIKIMIHNYSFKVA